MRGGGSSLDFGLAKVLISERDFSLSFSSRSLLKRPLLLCPASLSGQVLECDVSSQAPKVSLRRQPLRLPFFSLYPRGASLMRK